MRRPPAHKESSQKRQSRFFFRQLKTHYADHLHQWRSVLQQRGLSKQRWTLLTGPFSGCQVTISQSGLQRRIEILCPSAALADELTGLKTLLETACSGPWLDVFVTIEVRK